MKTCFVAVEIIQNEFIGVLEEQEFSDVSLFKSTVTDFYPTHKDAADYIMFSHKQIDITESFSIEELKEQAAEKDCQILYVHFISGGWHYLDMPDKINKFTKL